MEEQYCQAVELKHGPKKDPIRAYTNLLKWLN
jgi:hypothetical protein